MKLIVASILFTLVVVAVANEEIDLCGDKVDFQGCIECCKDNGHRKLDSKLMHEDGICKCVGLPVMPVSVEQTTGASAPCLEHYDRVECVKCCAENGFKKINSQLMSAESKCSCMGEPVVPV